MSAAAPTQSADLQDNVWGEHADWDFQDVPLDSPRSAHHKGVRSPNRNAAKDQAATAQKSAVPMLKQVSDAHEIADSSEKQVAVLQQENETLTRRLKHVELVSVDIA